MPDGTATEDTALKDTATRTVGGIEIPAPGDWVIDPAHSSVSFVARHMMVSKVRGHFGEFSGTIHVAEETERSWAEITIKAASIDTGTETRDTHLKSGDFLDVERFPELTFRSLRIEPGKGPNFRAHGQLTIRDVTRPVVLDVEYEGAIPDTRGGTRVAFSATTEIDREEFGITWNMALETGGVLVGRKVKIELEVAAVQAAEQPA
jgi:polyisoprenoid-binding protein YceI